jgi:4-carboxymuconolactone decarboxylase
VTDAAKPRLAPLPKERWGDEARAALDAGFPGAAERFLSTGPDAPRIPNVVTTLMHHPALSGPFLAFNRVLLQTPALGARLRELMVLRVAWRTRSTYEWLQHTRIAADLGMTPEDIVAITRGAGTGKWTPLEAELLAATDQLIDRHRIEDETWSRLAQHLDERQLVEVVFVVGTYTCLAMAFNSFGLQLDPGLEPGPGIPVPE